MNGHGQINECLSNPPLLLPEKLTPEDDSCRMTEQRPHRMAVYSGSGWLPPFRLPLWITMGMRGQRSPRHKCGFATSLFCATKLTWWLFFGVLNSDLRRANSHPRKCPISTGSLSCRGQRSGANKLSLPSCFLPTASVLKKALFLEFLLAFICTLSD